MKRSLRLRSPVTERQEDIVPERGSCSQPIEPRPVCSRVRGVAPIWRAMAHFLGRSGVEPLVRPELAPPQLWPRTLASFLVTN
jgi:hypothetical protein